MGQISSKTRGSDKGDDVKRQVDSDVSNRRAIYQLADVKTGGGKLIDLIKSRARRQSCSVNSSGGSSSGLVKSAGFSVTSREPSSEAKEDKALDEEIRRLVEPLLYNQGRGKRIPLSQLWRARFGLLEEGQEEEESEAEEVAGGDDEAGYRWTCWRLEQRGFVGETALHICFLLSTPSHMILAQKLLQMFPMLINDIYTCDEYFGESCLHMAIVNESIKIVKWLLDRGASVHERCLGSFFLPLDQKESRGTNERVRRILSLATSADEHTKVRPDFHWQSNEFSLLDTNYDGYCYWGEYALSFAASLGLADCYKLLLAKGADPNRQDSNGNSTLHICVIANRIDMFDLCYSNGANLNATNKQQLSSLTLAAKLQRVDMFFHILTIQRQVNWIFCQVCFQQIPLEALDSINTADGSYNEHSLLSIVVSGVSICPRP